MKTKVIGVLLLSFGFLKVQGQQFSEKIAKELSFEKTRKSYADDF